LVDQEQTVEAIAGKPAATEKRSGSALPLALPALSICFNHSGRLPGRRAVDVDLDLDLGAPSTTLAARGFEFVGNLAGRQVSRDGPRMAHRGGPRIQACVRAYRAGGEVPSGGARALLVTFGAPFQK
jgi:hypothetical protein